MLTVATRKYFPIFLYPQAAADTREILDEGNIIFAFALFCFCYFEAIRVWNIYLYKAIKKHFSTLVMFTLQTH